MSSNRFAPDAIERSAATTVQVVAGIWITTLADIDTWWAAPIALGLAALKALAAKHWGQPGTASALPATSDPAGPSSTVYGPQ